MAYIQVEASVRTHKKFLQAGPAPSWLWLCGLAYCQEGMTDGFIPAEAINYLGVKNAKQLADHLVKAGLWDVADGGWQVHDYLVHNRSAAQIAELRDRRGSGGKLGGRPKKNLPENLHQTSKVSGPETIVKTHPRGVADSVAVADVDLKGKGSGKPEPRLDVWLLELQGLYPPHRVTRNVITMQAFVDAMTKASDGPIAAYARLRANLTANLASFEWRSKGMVPWLERYLRDGLWENVLPADAAPAASATGGRSRPGWAPRP